MQKVRANEAVSELGEDKANQEDEVSPAAEILLHVADVLDAHVDFGSRFIFDCGRTWLATSQRAFPRASWRPFAV